mgnify:CR=1 FL=1
MYRKIKTKTILSKLKVPGYDPFGIVYNMNLYRGCQHQCIYCDSRSECYQLGDLRDIRVKENAIELLSKELLSKRKKGTVGTGSMNDPYMPIENELKLTRQALKELRRFQFPVHIITKSDLVTRDIDIIKDIAKLYAAISITITSADDKLSQKIEPAAPLSSARFKAIKELSKNGIYCGVLITPVLPFISDSPENIITLIQKASDAGANYILMWPGMTQRTGQREWYYDKLDKIFPGIKDRYIQEFGSEYGCSSPNAKELYDLYHMKCKELGLATKMDFYKEKKLQGELF